MSDTNDIVLNLLGESLYHQLTIQTNVQLLNIAESWNFLTPPEGQMASMAFQFADSIPQSDASNNQFVSSSKSFNNNFIAFMNLLSDKFENQDILKKTLNFASRPHGEPAVSEPPPGWTKVPDGSNRLQWQPSYSYGSSEQPSTSLKLGKELDKTTNLMKVRICPDFWYNSSLIVTAKKSPENCFKSGWSADKIFGQDKLLDCRIAELIIAEKSNSQKLVVGVIIEKFYDDNTPSVSGKEIKFGDNFCLRNKSGEYIIGAELSLGFGHIQQQYYPRLGNTGKISLAFNGGIGKVNDGKKIQIKSTEQELGKYNVLGAWNSPDCYYYKTDNYGEQNWQINKKNPRDNTIRYGDEVYLSNEYYTNQRLIKKGMYLTTKQEVDEWWIIEAEN